MDFTLASTPIPLPPSTSRSSFVDNNCRLHTPLCLPKSLPLCNRNSTQSRRPVWLGRHTMRVCVRMRKKEKEREREREKDWERERVWEREIPCVERERVKITFFLHKNWENLSLTINWVSSTYYSLTLTLSLSLSYSILLSLNHTPSLSSFLSLTLSL